MVFEVQNEIAEAIVSDIGPEIADAERDRAQRLPPDSFPSLWVEGYWHSIRGHAYFDVQRDGHSAMSDSRTQRRLAAVLAADVAGYTRLMRLDEDGTMAAWWAYRHEVIDPTVAQHGGRIVKHTGDGFLAEFSSATDAVSAAISMQSGIASRNIDVSADRRMQFRVGINLGDILWDGEDIYGDGVNIAARIEALANPGGIVISANVHEQVAHRVQARFEDLGAQRLKNIDTPIKVYRIRLPEDERRLSSAAQAPSSALSIPDRPSIVILPFANLTGDPAEDYLSDGLRIDIQNALVKVSGAFLIAAGSAQAYHGRTVNEATSKLGVRYALEGSVRRAGNRVRISMSLTDGIADEIVWAETYDRELDDAFALLDEITGRVLTAMNVKLVAGEPARVWHKTLPDLKSLEAFYRGVHEFFKMDSASLANARQQFELVARLHPEASVGPTWIALTHWYDFQRGWSESRAQSRELAKKWAQRAIAQPDADGQAHTVLCHVHLLDRQFHAALAAGRDAVANRPNCTHANGFYANVLHYCGENERARQHIELAMRYSPLHPTLFKDIRAAICRASGDFDEARRAAETAITSDPNDLVARLLLTSVAVNQKRLDDAARVAKEIERVDPAFSIAQFAAGQPYRYPEFLEELVADLRAAGLPE